MIVKKLITLKVSLCLLFMQVPMISSAEINYLAPPFVIGQLSDAMNKKIRVKTIDHLEIEETLRIYLAKYLDRNEVNNEIIEMFKEAIVRKTDIQRNPKCCEVDGRPVWIFEYNKGVQKKLAVFDVLSLSVLLDIPITSRELEEQWNVVGEALHITTPGDLAIDQPNNGYAVHSYNLPDLVEAGKVDLPIGDITDEKIKDFLTNRSIEITSGFLPDLFPKKLKNKFAKLKAFSRITAAGGKEIFIIEREGSLSVVDKDGKEILIRTGAEENRKWGIVGNNELHITHRDNIVGDSMGTYKNQNNVERFSLIDLFKGLKDQAYFITTRPESKAGWSEWAKTIRGSMVHNTQFISATRVRCGHDEIVFAAVKDTKGSNNKFFTLLIFVNGSEIASASIDKEEAERRIRYNKDGHLELVFRKYGEKAEKHYAISDIAQGKVVETIYEVDLEKYDLVPEYIKKHIVKRELVKRITRVKYGGDIFWFVDQTIDGTQQLSVYRNNEKAFTRSGCTWLVDCSYNTGKLTAMIYNELLYQGMKPDEDIEIGEWAAKAQTATPLILSDVNKAEIETQRAL